MMKLIVIICICLSVCLGQQLYVNFQPFVDSGCSGQPTIGVGYSMATDQCLQFPNGTKSYYFFVDALISGLRIYDNSNGGTGPDCSESYTFTAFKNKTCLTNVEYDQALDIVTPNALVGITKVPYVPASPISIVTSYYNQSISGGIGDDICTKSANLVMLDYILNGTTTTSGTNNQITSIFYCNEQLEPIQEICVNSECNQISLQVTCQQNPIDPGYFYQTICS
ncbi:hypothetical protein DLAC_01541 [Tieghemostelium lacteum]|uniref:Transmembrane protein n=1 Tax=Tieghemostelium lacteum TaxID=361077 RepID=A0A152A652_TIELA|nr:hypothetical protein DLAC_01541 [Tieghemostelium lacteum]|eukprot:KYR01547.1 hypothetical protein DLAC_01541 [Tieghemostelium lacteum]